MWRGHPGGYAGGTLSGARLIWARLIGNGCVRALTACRPLRSRELTSAEARAKTLNLKGPDEIPKDPPQRTRASPARTNDAGNSSRRSSRMHGRRDPGCQLDGAPRQVDPQDGRARSAPNQRSADRRGQSTPSWPSGLGAGPWTWPTFVIAIPHSGSKNMTSRGCS